MLQCLVMQQVPAGVAVPADVVPVFFVLLWLCLLNDSLVVWHLVGALFYKEYVFSERLCLLVPVSVRLVAYRDLFVSD